MKVKQIIKQLEADGWVLYSEKKHFKLKKHSEVLVISKTASDRRAFMNIQQTIRKAERNIQINL